MCGIVGAVARGNCVPVLLEGLKRLEYRGYDSAGLATILEDDRLAVRRAVGKVSQLVARVEREPCDGHVGIAHSRWATHGGVTEANAHPHASPRTDDGRVAVVHNGIIENYAALKQALEAKGYHFASETDTEVVAHLIHSELQSGDDLVVAVRRAVTQLRGAYAIVALDVHAPDRLVVARVASPLVIGLGAGENFAASDVAALLPVTQRFIYLEEGDVAEIRRDGITITDVEGNARTREIHDVGLHPEATEKAGFRHFMLKEIHEQPIALANTLQGRIGSDRALAESLGPRGAELLAAAEHVHIVACGTSYHAGCVAKYWIEALARIPCQVELASEYRYRSVVVPRNTLFITLSQSGETADTLAALAFARNAGYLARLTICNSAQSSMVRESDLVMLTRAGPEIGVASTKAFTTQLLAALTIAAMLGRQHGLEPAREAEILHSLQAAPAAVERVLEMDDAIRRLAERFVEKHHALFLGRGPMFPVAMEGALKLKEISYIHAEAYAAGELKHGPLALIDEDMPVIVVAPSNALLDKLKSNMQQVRARGGQLFVLAEAGAGIASEPGIEWVSMPPVETAIAPIVYTVPLQLLAYHVAVLRGTDVDQPRNLAKSVTVE